ncbi:MAG: cytochrome-c peroxidase [Cytophagales bacterium]|nr:cytochrome-c peroxidase [Cytophagales bacterium]
MKTFLSTLLIVLFIALAGSLTSFHTVHVHEREPATVAQLGEKLFFDPILSKDRTISCASCHKREFAFADNTAFSVGINGIPTKRNAPSAANLSGRLQLFWDGRVNSLEEQALKPIESPDEMNLPIIEAVDRLQRDEMYGRVFRKLFKSAPTADLLAKAIAEFERTLETADSPYDRFIDGDESAMNESAIRGRLLFIGKANCANCHAGDDFTADRFKNIGLYNGKELDDPGRFEVTQDSSQLGHFRIPGLRNVALTAPYMHNGMFSTLREVLDYYNRPDEIISGAIHRDLSLSEPLNLSEQEINDLEEFLHALTDDQFLKTKKTNN